MTLDLIVRGAGSSRSPEEHLTAVLAEYEDLTLILYGDAAGAEGFPQAVRTADDPGALAAALRSVGNGQAVVYGDETLLSLVQEMQPNLIWITLGPDANGVREIWRVRQQHSWLSQRKLGLVIEQVADGAPPDTDRLMRLSRATRAVLVPVRAAEVIAPSRHPSFPAFETAPEPDAAAPEPEEPAADAAEPEGQSDTAAEAEAEADDAEAETEAVLEIEVTSEAEAEPAVSPEPVPAFTSYDKGADVVMETNTMDRQESAAPMSAQAEQALMQRYALVKERRATSSRLAQVEGTIQNLLKEIFVSRFHSGPEAAAGFESLSRKLTEAAAEQTQLSRAMANIEAQLAKLAWLKDELEI